MLALAQALAGRGIASLGPRTQRLLSGGRRIEVDGQVLDPGIQLMLAAMRLRGGDELVPSPEITAPALRARMRRDARSVARWPTQVAAVHERSVDGAVGPLPARHYIPAASAAPAPLLVFLHGGGWVLGDLETHDEACRRLCRDAGVHVLSVAYRLAPEHPFPAGVEDAVAAFRWASGAAAKLGADAARVAIGGDSAGGNLAAVACQQLVLRGGPMPVAQLLIYPSTDLAGETRSAELFATGYFLTRRSRKWCEGQYVGDGVDRADVRISPLRSGDLTRQPPAIVTTAGFDPLRDQGEAYAEALRAAGVPVVLYREESLIHGFINFTVVNRASSDALGRIAGTLRSELGV